MAAPPDDRNTALTDYWSNVCERREIFILESGQLVTEFHRLLSGLAETWQPLGQYPDKEGGSHAGLLTLTTVLERQLLLAFSSMMSAQCNLAWMVLRPGLEALLMKGVWADDPERAATWSNWQSDRRAYMATFNKATLSTSSLPGSDHFVDVLSELNNRFLHPNPEYVLPRARLQETEQGYQLDQRFFDTRDSQTVNALALLSLVEMMWICSAEFVRNVISIQNARDIPQREVPARYDAVARELKAGSDKNTQILEDLGQWQWNGNSR